MSHTTRGYGAFRLDDLLTGEEFMRHDGTLGRVVWQLGKVPEHSLVRLDVGTANEREALLRETTLVLATSPEQAKRIARRVRDRQRRAKTKGEGT